MKKQITLIKSLAIGVALTASNNALASKHYIGAEVLPIQIHSTEAKDTNLTAFGLHYGYEWDVKDSKSIYSELGIAKGSRDLFDYEHVSIKIGHSWYNNHPIRLSAFGMVLTGKQELGNSYKKNFTALGAGVEAGYIISSNFMVSASANYNTHHASASINARLGF